MRARPRSFVLSRGAVAAALVVLAGCAPNYRVTRVVDGRTVDGHFVPADAYAWFLRGALAEAGGDRQGAVSAYEQAARIDPDDPEVWSRVAMARCRMRPDDPEAGHAIARARALDPEYAPAWEASAGCAWLRHDRAAALEGAQRAAALDPSHIDYQVFLTGLEQRDPRREEAARARIRALTLAHGTSSTAFRALLAFAWSHGDAWLSADAIEHLARLAPARRGEIVRIVASLAGSGEIVAARRAAAAIVDHAEGGLSATAPPEPARDLVARLALDDAILRGDRDLVARRATASHLGADVAAGRAVLLGAPELARALVDPVLDAEPSALGARLVALAAAPPSASGPEQAKLASLIAGLREAKEPLPLEVALPFLRLVARAIPASDRGDVALPLAPVVTSDDLTTRALVDAVAAKMIDRAALDPNGRVELATLEATPYAGRLDALDVRHRLLALTLPGASSTAHDPVPRGVRDAVGRDPIVTVAVARLALRSSDALPESLLVALRRLSPADALVLEAAVDVAHRRGDAAAEQELRAQRAALTTLPPRL